MEDLVTGDPVVADLAAVHSLKLDPVTGRRKCGSSYAR